MTSDDFRVEYVEPDLRPIVVEKKVWDGQVNEFVPIRYVRFTFIRSAELSEAGKWLGLQVGPARENGQWWVVTNHIYMHEKIATWWSLVRKET
jgi:hypothetical protein